jgi:hypothetical protein
MNKSTVAKVVVTSIWSKIEGAEGRLMGRDKNVVYPVIVKRGETAEDTLENAFVKTNADDRPFGTTCCSTTAGDIMKLDGQDYLVGIFGFHAITADEAAQIAKLSSRDTSFGYDFLVKRGLINATAVTAS